MKMQRHSTMTTTWTMQVAPEWERLTAHIEADPESKERLGWVREMYAFSTALALKKDGAWTSLPAQSVP